MNSHAVVPSYVVAGFGSCERITGKLIPLLVKEGWPRHQKMVPFRKGADGVVARESRFATRYLAIPKTTRHAQPIRNSRPPTGVTAPSIPTPVSARA